MATVYILYSPKVDRYYIGSCLNMQERLQQHLLGEFKDCFTSRATDWEIFWQLNNLSERQARGIELHIKKMRNRDYYHNIKKFPDISEKLLVKYV